jgi:hypothetical protein
LDGKKLGEKSLRNNYELLSKDKKKPIENIKGGEND